MQGGPLSAKLFNIILNVMVRKKMWLMRELLNNTKDDLADRIKVLLALFYVDNKYIASGNAKFLQEALDILVAMFKHVGLETNTKKTQAMVCTPGRILVQLPTDSYRCMGEGVVAGEETTHAVTCHACC
jgi:hypothetical protein